MNLTYISGFFDADGSISLINIHKNENKSVQVSICNNELSILKRIQQYLLEKHQIRGSISRKKAQKKTHSDNFELKFTRNSALTLIKLLQSQHPKKQHRIQVALKYYKQVTKRNGKYSEKDLSKKEAFNRLFMWVK
jgi:hypothetical protein